MKIRKIPSKLFTLGVGLMLTLGFSTKVQALPVSASFFPGTTAGEYAVGLQYLHFDFKRSVDVPAAAALNPASTTDLLAAFGFYGITKTYGLFLFVPWVHNVFKIDNAPPTPGRFNLKATGWGDPALSGFFRIYDWQGKKWFFTVGNQTGVQFPAGDWNQKYKGNSIPRQLQPGKGNWSAFTTFIGSGFTPDHNVTVAMTFQPYFRGHGYRHGHQFIYQGSLGHRVLPWMLKSGQSPVFFLDANLEFIGIYTSKSSDNIVPWSNWGRMIGSINMQFPRWYMNLNFAFHQTVYWKVGEPASILRPQRVYQVSAVWGW